MGKNKMLIGREANGGRAGDSDQIPEKVDPVAIRRMRFVATGLDNQFRVPGTNYRFGLDPILGLLPGGGDLLSAGISLYIVLEAARQGVSNRTIVRMLGNVAVDAAVGTIPLLGDLFDVVFKANARNVKLALAELDVQFEPASDTETSITIE